MIKIKRSVPIIGVGGATGSGKSSVAHSFSTHNAMIIDLDRLSHDPLKRKAVMESSGSCFWFRIFKPKGELQRKSWEE